MSELIDWWGRGSAGVAAVLLLTACVREAPQGLPSQSVLGGSDREACDVLAALVMAQYPSASGVNELPLMQGPNDFGAQCPWETYGLRFPERYDDDWKPPPCENKGDGLYSLDEKGQPHKMCEAFQPWIQFSRPKISRDGRTAVVESTGYAWGPLWGGFAGPCHLAKERGRWIHKSCAPGAVI